MLSSRVSIRYLLCLGLLAAIPRLEAQTLMPGREVIVSLQHAGWTRQARVYLGSSATGALDVPTVIMFHGAGGTASTNQWRRQADRAGLLIVAPQALVSPRGNTSWDNGDAVWGTSGGLADDPGFIDQLIQTLSSRTRIDRNRLYAAGFSSGAVMTLRLAQERSQMFAAYAAVAGALPVSRQNIRPAQPVALLMINNRDDTTVRYDGGNRGAAGALLPAGPSRPSVTGPTTWALAATWSGCATAAATSETFGQELRSLEYSYADCLRTVRGISTATDNGAGGHSIPTLTRRDNNDFDAIVLMSNFFLENPRR